MTSEEADRDTSKAVGASLGGSKLVSQLNKLREANNKYKTLLKLAKERITERDEEMETLKEKNKRLMEEVQTAEQSTPNFSMGDEVGTDGMEENASAIMQVCQRVKDRDTIWALFDFQIEALDSFNPSRHYQKWKRFDSEAELQDYIRRDTGEPLLLPPFSLSPEQSKKIEKEAAQSVSQVTEEFRRFRVRSEVQRKQTDAHIRDLQNNNVQSAKRRIEGEDLEKELEQARSDHMQLELLKNELAAQEIQWKEAYNVVIAENQSLKSSGSEALLAAQWRQRYETCMSEKEDLQCRLQIELEKSEILGDQRRKLDAGKYEMKYRDLKESFRLYRQKAKEIFEAQQRGDVALLNLADKSSEEAKLSYIRNLMVNYLSSDVAVREHMEGAIGTVLGFTTDDVAKIEQKKTESEAWF
mmetsp:Transcript_37761/g.43130  ORF Transcript_37761/g.43130 Transcript_37761/m.43130 type:complete len:413 (-) Transcript_37761:31-1269(-)